MPLNLCHSPWYRCLRTIPNLITVLRPVGIPLFLWWCARRSWAALGLYVVIVLSDMLDGWLARRLRRSSAFGRTFDHVADVAFILAALLYFAWLGMIPWALPLSIAWAFAMYWADSWRRTAAAAERRLLGSRLGHVGGVLYYATVGLLTWHLLHPTLRLPEPLLQGWSIGVSVLAGVSGLQRLLDWLGAVKPGAPAAPGAKNLPRSDCSAP